MALQPQQRAAMRGQFKTQARPTPKQHKHQERLLINMEINLEERRMYKWMKKGWW